MNLPHLDRLLDAYLDGALTKADCRELEALLLSDSEARQVFWSRVRMHSELRKIGREMWGRRIAESVISSEETELSAEEPLPSHSSPSKGTSGSSKSRTFRLMHFAPALLVIALALAAILWWAAPHLRQRQMASQAPEFLATIEHAVNTTLAVGQTLGPGPIEVSTGVIQLRFNDGAILVAQGPSKLRIESKHSVILERGLVQVEATDGFVVKAPNASITDLGTRFGVSVAPDGVVEAHVFEGRLELAAAGSTLQLSKDEAAAVKGSTVRRVTAEADAFPMPARELSVPLAGAGFEPGTIVQASNLTDSSTVNIPLAGAGFEPGTPVESLNTPATPGIWSGDKAVICGVFGNVKPRTGRGMLRFLRVIKAPESSIDQWQLVDLRPYRNLLESGGASADFTVWFNGERPGVFSLSIFAWKETGESPLHVWIRRFSPGAHFRSAPATTDADPSTWEPARVELPLPEDADYLLVHTGAGREPNGLATVGGQFADDATLTLRVPPQAGRVQLVRR